MSNRPLADRRRREASRIAGALREGQHCVVTTRPNQTARQGLKPVP
ncbi:hypothetical protein MJ561_14455 [Klebsiella pneumoniae]|nr:hypothetical protein MJ561_14455 [Klebsiella pneumoniae]